MERTAEQRKEAEAIGRRERLGCRRTRGLNEAPMGRRSPEKNISSQKTRL